MRQITVDFKTSPIEAGYLGEHNATELVLVKPTDITGTMYSVAFMTNGEVIHSKFFGADEEIRVALWQQLTQDNNLYIQLEAYNENGDYLGKSATIRLVLSNSVHGVDIIADADNADVYSEIALNTRFRETLKDNVDTLDKLTTSLDGKLLFDGQLIEGTGGVSGTLDIEVKVDTEDEYILSLSTPDETLTTPNLKGKDGEKGDKGKSAYQSAVDGGYMGTEEEFNSLLANIKRPTAVFEFEGSTESFAAADAINSNDLLIGDFYMEANIPVGVEIKSIEFMYDEDIGWVDIREMQTVDGAAYTLSMHRTFLSDRICDPGITCFAIVTFIQSANFIFEAAHAGQDGKFRITYYTDNIGGENNA